jgi:uncharacterized protein YjdB
MQKEKDMKKIFKGGIVFILALLLAVPVVLVGVKTTEAASKPKLNKSSMTISIGTYNMGSSLQANDNAAIGKKGTAITVKNAKSGATYTFSSSNKKVATVKGSGKKGVVTGVNKGTAKITVKQKYKGKTTTVGTCKVTVKQATLGKGTVTDRLMIGTDVENYEIYGTGILYMIDIKYMNSSAKYTYTVDKAGLKITQSIEKGWGVAQKYTATEAGTYQVTVKETYKKKTRTLGSFEVTVLPVYVSEAETMYIGSDDTDTSLRGNSIEGVLRNGGYIYYYAELADNSYGSDVKLVSQDGYYAENLIIKEYWLESSVEGTVKINLYYSDKNGTKGDLIGTCTITMKAPKVKAIVYPDTITMVEGDEGFIEEFDPNFDYNDEDAEYGVVMEDEDMGEVEATYTSSDKSVVKVDSEGELEAVSAGKAVITVTAGDVTKEITVIVKEED